MGISMGCSGMPAAPPDRAGMCAHPFGIQGYPFPVLLIPLLTRQEGIGGGVGLLLADVGEGDAAVAVLPPPGRLGADHPAVLLTGVVGLVWKAG